MTSTTRPTCDACDRPVADNARLCSRKPTSRTDLGGCTERFARDLGDIGALSEELTTTRLRQARTGGAATGVLSRSADTPLPWNEKAGEVYDDLRGTVVAWSRIVCEERGSVCPRDDMGAMGTALLGALEWLRHHEAAGEALDEIGHATERARHAIDRHSERTYAGPCREIIEAHDDHGEASCLSELYVREGARKVVCQTCAAEHDVAERKAWLLAIAQHQIVTMEELDRLLSFVGHPVPRSTMKSWVQRKRLVAHGANPARYYVKDAIDLMLHRESTKTRSAEADCA